MKKLCQLSYENFLENNTTPEIDDLNKQIDGKLKQLLPPEAFEEIYNLTAELQGLIEEHAYQAGFMAGLDR